MFFAHRITGLPGCWVAVMFNHLSAWVAVRDGSAATSEAAAVLTPRELDVLTLVAQGLSNPDIAQRLVLSEHTVRRHPANISRKLRLSSRAAAVAWGVHPGPV